MNKIAIFGDSFADPKWARNDFYKAWPELLEQDATVDNFSLSGTGVWWSYKQYKKIHEDYDYNIFVLTIPGRIHIESLDRHLNFNPITWPVWYGTNFGEVYFKYFYSQEREECFHNFILNDLLQTKNTLVIPAFVESMPKGYSDWSLCHLADTEMYHYGMQHPGNNERRKCHLTKENNEVVYNKIKSAIASNESLLKLTNLDFVAPAEPMHRYWF